MRKFSFAVAVAAVMACGALGVAAPAVARDQVVFSFNPDSVAFGFRDGYWDNDHRWHRWRHAREAAAFRERYRDRYHHVLHSRDSDERWHHYDRWHD